MSKHRQARAPHLFCNNIFHLTFEKSAILVEMWFPNGILWFKDDCTERMEQSVKVGWHRKLLIRESSNSSLYKIYIITFIVLSKLFCVDSQSPSQDRPGLCFSPAPALDLSLSPSSRHISSLSPSPSSPSSLSPSSPLDSPGSSSSPQPHLFSRVSPGVLKWRLQERCCVLRLYQE